MLTQKLMGFQADAYFELLKPQRAALLKKSAALARHLLSEYRDVTFEELALEISVRTSNGVRMPPYRNVLPLKDLLDGQHVLDDCTFNLRQHIRHG